jgi:hypothetical protein
VSFDGNEKTEKARTKKVAGTLNGLERKKTPSSLNIYARMFPFMSRISLNCADAREKRCKKKLSSMAT